MSLRRLVGVQILALALVLLVGCKAQFVGENIGPDSIRVSHDDRRGVTCWVVYGYDTKGVAISCLPDSALKDGGQ